MTEEGTVNSQIVDSVANVVTLATGQSASQAFGMMDAVMLETLGMSMHNAVHRQQSSGMINSAAVTAACAKILSTPLGPPQPPAKKPDPPKVNPLDGPNGPIPASVEMDKAMTRGKDAINALKAIGAEADKQATTADATFQQVKVDLDELVAEASGSDSTKEPQRPPTRGGETTGQPPKAIAPPPPPPPPPATANNNNDNVNDNDNDNDNDNNSN